MKKGYISQHVLQVGNTVYNTVVERHTLTCAAQWKDHTGENEVTSEGPDVDSALENLREALRMYQEDEL